MNKQRAMMTILVLAVPVAFYVGGVSGFGKGYEAALYAESGGVATTVLMLTNARAGDTKPVVEMLELQLDSLVVQNSVGWRSFDSAFNIPRIMGVGTAQMIDLGAKAALKYRAQVPSAAEPRAKAEVDAALAELAKRTHAKP